MSLIIDSKYVRLLSSRLRNFKQKKDNLWNFSCPICGDSKKNLSKARGYVYAKGNSLFYSCHNCGAGTNVANLIKSVDESLLKEYVLERYKEGAKGTRSVSPTALNIHPPRFDKLDKQKLFEHGEWCNQLKSGHFCLTYLQKRKIPSEYYGKLLFTSHYKQFIDALVPNHGKQLIDDARLVIPFYDEYNNLIAVSGRALENSDKTLRYITIRTIDSDKKLVYGIDRVDLKQPATSLKVLVGSYRAASADFRVLYQLFRTDSAGVEQAFELFPGYDNLKDTNGDGYGDTIIDSTRNSGRADAFVPASQDNEYREYQFSIDNLEQFTGFRIKIVMSGTNEAQAPKFKDLRAIALA